MRATNAKAMRLHESAPRAVYLLSLILGIALLLASLSGCGPPSSQGDGKPGGSDPSAANGLLELTDETIHERINETRVWEVPEESGTADPIVWNFDDDEPKEIRVVEKQMQGTRATLILDITTSSAPGVRNPRPLGEMEGLRAAEPGEFTRRAFENDRIDLAEAEGLADLLEAETEAQRRAALSLAGGALSRQVEAWQARLLDIAAQCEAELDFDDEGDVRQSGNRQIRSDIEALAAEIGEWLERPGAERLKDGVRVVIAGPPNAGKSSLLNALAGRDAAITSPTPGTTRDAIEAPVAIEGVPFLLVDTAGLRDSGDEIEAIGIERARLHVETADILLWLGEPGAAPEGAVRVHSKSDLTGDDVKADISVSAVTGVGIDPLVRMLIQRSSEILPQAGEVALNRRHRGALDEAKSALGEAAGAQDPLISAEELRRARGALDRVTGGAGVEDMLDTLFGRFCIGK